VSNPNDLEPLEPSHFATDAHCCACLASTPHAEPDASGCEFCDRAVALATDGRSMFLAEYPVKLPDGSWRFYAEPEWRASLRRPCVHQDVGRALMCGGPDASETEFLCIHCRVAAETEATQRRNSNG
jgi:hypothetical protein